MISVALVLIFHVKEEGKTVVSSESYFNSLAAGEISGRSLSDIYLHTGLGKMLL